MDRRNSLPARGRGRPKAAVQPPENSRDRKWVSASLSLALLQDELGGKSGAADFLRDGVLSNSIRAAAVVTSLTLLEIAQRTYLSGEPEGQFVTLGERIDELSDLEDEDWYFSDDVVVLEAGRSVHKQVKLEMLRFYLEDINDLVPRYSFMVVQRDTGGRKASRRAWIKLVAKLCAEIGDTKLRQLSRPELAKRVVDAADEEFERSTLEEVISSIYDELHRS